MSKRKVFDVCVIGTGAGGGVMIDELTSAGFEVVALERGKMWRSADFMTHDELSSQIRSHQFWSPDFVETFRSNENSTAVPGNYSSIAQGVGGGTAHWHGAAWRFRPDEMKVLSSDGPLAGANLADWPIGYKELEPYYEKAESVFGVAGNAGENPWGAPMKSSYPNPAHPYRTSSFTISKAAKKLGLDTFSTPTAINSQFYGGRPACMNAGMCGYYGCPIHAKASTLAISIPRALATGKLDLKTHSLAYEITVDAQGKAKSVLYFDSDGNTHEVFAKQIVVSCHSISSAQLLQHSKSSLFPNGIANNNDVVGRNIMFHIASMVQFEMDSPQHGALGPSGMVAIDNFHPSDASRGFIRGGAILESPATSPISSTLAAAYGHGGKPSLWGAELKAIIPKFKNRVGLFSPSEDMPVANNRIDLDPDTKDRFGIPAPRLTHQRHENDIKLHTFMNRQMIEIAEAAKAERIWSLDTVDVRGGTTHIMGTCRMGNDPETSVLNKWNQTHEVKNLWVVDASFFPTSGGYNPTLTILANSYRVADHFIHQAKTRNL